MKIHPPDYTPQLRRWMEQAGLSSFKALSRTAEVSEKQIRNLRRGKVAQLRLEILQKIAQVLQVSVIDLLNTVSPQIASSPSQKSDTLSLETLQQEYQRLQIQLAEQKQQLQQEFQQASVQILESLILQLPTAAYAAQQNPQAPAVKLLPLLRPIDALLHQWGIEAIAPVGTELPYDPQRHQLMAGSAAPGDRVRVRYTGYQQGDQLLYRARVSRVEGEG